MQCPRCRYENPPTFTTCVGCRQPLRPTSAVPAPSPTPAAAAPTRKDGTAARPALAIAYLQVLDGARAQQVEELNPSASLFIGSGENVHIRVPDPGVEGRHCQVYPAKNAFWLQDLGQGSTVLQDKPLVSTARALRAGDVFVIGRTSIRFLAEKPAPAPPVPRPGTARWPGKPATPAAAAPPSQRATARMSAPPTTPPTKATSVGDTRALAPLRQAPSEAVQAPSSRLAAIDPEDPRIVAWLCCDPLPPVPVGTEPTLTLGRDPASGLVLPHGGVSRTHAVVRVSGRDLVFEDRSTYGSYVNGERVLTRPLSIGDVLILGPYEIKLRSTQEVRAGEGDPLAQTRPLETFRNLPSSEAMSGRLEKAPLPEVLQAIEFNQKTGTLEVFTDEDTKGQLTIFKGMPMCASFGRDEVARIEGAEAVLAMLAQRRGYYSFRSKIDAGERTIEGTITALLLEAGRRADEGTR